MRDENQNLPRLLRVMQFFAIDTRVEDVKILSYKLRLIEMYFTATACMRSRVFIESVRKARELFVTTKTVEKILRRLNDCKT